MQGVVWCDLHRETIKEVQAEQVKRCTAALFCKRNVVSSVTFHTDRKIDNFFSYSYTLFTVCSLTKKKASVGLYRRADSLDSALVFSGRGHVLVVSC